MSQITTGIRSILSHPFIYKTVQNMLGANKVRIQCVEKYIRPFKNAKILDIGCGTADILKFLPNSVEYIGFDLNNHYINYAKNKFGNRGTFICNDVNNQIKNLPPFDIILATGLLHHLDDAEVNKLFTMATNALKESGRMVTFDGCFLENQSRVAKFIIKKDRGQNVRFPNEYKNLAETSFNHVKVNIHHDLLRIPYTHIIMECSKSII